MTIITWVDELKKVDTEGVNLCSSFNESMNMREDKSDSNSQMI